MLKRADFGYSCTGRSVLEVALSVAGTSLRCATVHLESPTPGAPATAPRKQQLSQACLTKPLIVPVIGHSVAWTCRPCCSLGAHLLLHKGGLSQVVAARTV